METQEGEARLNLPNPQPPKGNLWRRMFERMLDAENRYENYVKTAKYTPANFLFKCGAEQFQIVSNLYFLFIVVLAYAGQYSNLFDPPVSGIGTLLALGVVVGFSMMFEGYYDTKRHREDKKVNARQVQRLRPGKSF